MSCLEFLALAVLLVEMSRISLICQIKQIKIMFAFPNLDKAA